MGGEFFRKAARGEVGRKTAVDGRFVSIAVVLGPLGCSEADISFEPVDPDTVPGNIGCSAVT